MEKLKESELIKLYTQQGKSAAEIAAYYGCSENKIHYWLAKFAIPKRSISEAVYRSYHPNGDPFLIMKPDSLYRAFLLGLGVGLYWGEGTKSNRHSVRLGNSDPRLIRAFIMYLEEIYKIDRAALKFGLQVFSTMPAKQALNFWIKELSVSSKQFQKVIITPSRGFGNYKRKIPHGVLTVYFNNRKLRDIICHAIDDFDGVLSSFKPS